MNTTIPKSLANQLYRFAPRELIHSSELERVWKMLSEPGEDALNEPLKKGSSDASQRQLTQIVKTICAFADEMVSRDHAVNDPIRRKEAAAVLRKAADILSGDYPAETILVDRKRGGAGLVGSIRLAARLVAQPTNQTVDAKYFGNRGGASDEAGARTGAVIRCLNDLIPAVAKNRYALISNLLKTVCKENAPSSMLVRSLIDDGRSKRIP
jgi:hypothetical protein